MKKYSNYWLQDKWRLSVPRTFIEILIFIDDNSNEYSAKSLKGYACKVERGGWIA